MPNVSVPIAIQRKQEIIERLSSGEMVQQIADSLGCRRETISVTLAADPEYRAALTESIDARLEIREQALAAAQDGLTLAREDKRLAHTRWLAERLNSSKYGQVKQAIQVNSDGPTSVKIVSWSETDAPGGG